jgi:hypothetical protein
MQNNCGEPQHVDYSEHLTLLALQLGGGSKINDRCVQVTKRGLAAIGPMPTKLKRALIVLQGEML